MKRQAFYAKHRLADARPIDVARRYILAQDFADSVTDFLTDNFSGICTVTHDVPNARFYIRICAEMAAYFLKLLLAYVNGEEHIDIHISTPTDQLVITVGGVGDLPYDFEDLNKLTRAAKNAGFDIKVEDTKIILSATLKLSARLRVYAIRRYVMHGKLNEIFYTGGPIVTG